MLASVVEVKHEDFRRIASPFEGRLTRLRAVEEGDLSRINEAFWDPDVSQYLAMVWPEPVAGTRQWWERTRANPTTQAFVIETLAGELIGVCSIEDVSARHRSGEVGIWIARPYWSQGYGTDALRTLCRFGFQEMNLQHIRLRVNEDNPRGRRAYAKAGFREEGMLRSDQFVGGRYVDVVVMSVSPEELVPE
jgi:RimJ/RimL family protein N-acetyltransferase